MEPPSRLEFSNSSGGWLDCSASGSAQPTIDWHSIDGSSIGDIGGLRRILRNGTMVLLPFSEASYRQDVHNTIYRCVASNRVGRIISRDVNVRAGEWNSSIDWEVKRYTTQQWWSETRRKKREHSQIDFYPLHTLGCMECLKNNSSTNPALLHPYILFIGVEIELKPNSRRRSTEAQTIVFRSLHGAFFITQREISSHFPHPSMLLRLL